MIRLNKYLSEAGICSRREADRLIQEGRVTVDGAPAEPGMKLPEDGSVLVKVDGKPVENTAAEEILLVVNKPRGIICTSEKRKGTVNIDQFLNYPVRVFSIGRLDKDSEGLLLMTNNGEIVNRIMRARNYHEKEYEVRVNRPLSEDFLRKMRSGVTIPIPEGNSVRKVLTRPCKVTKTGKDSFSIVLTQGLNRQIRRMCLELGYKVVSLKRVRIMNIKLGDLKTGAYRKVTSEERKVLESILT